LPGTLCGSVNENDDESGELFNTGGAGAPLSLTHAPPSVAGAELAGWLAAPA